MLFGLVGKRTDTFPVDAARMRDHGGTVRRLYIYSAKFAPRFDSFLRSILAGERIKAFALDLGSDKSLLLTMDTRKSKCVFSFDRELTSEVIERLLITTLDREFSRKTFELSICRENVMERIAMDPDWDPSSRDAFGGVANGLSYRVLERFLHEV